MFGLQRIVARPAVGAARLAIATRGPAFTGKLGTVRCGIEESRRNGKAEQVEMTGKEWRIGWVWMPGMEWTRVQEYCKGGRTGKDGDRPDGRQGKDERNPAQDVAIRSLARRS